MLRQRTLTLLTATALCACAPAKFHPADRIDQDGDGYFAVANWDAYAAALGEGITVDALRSAGVDCDDTSPDIFPGAFELCDGIDNDCVPGGNEHETDEDLDGATDCGWSPAENEFDPDAADCNDDPAAFGALQGPGRTEICGVPRAEGLAPTGYDASRLQTWDDDCDGAATEGEWDGDRDGHMAGCEADPDIHAPGTSALLSVDCVDGDATVHPSVAIIPGQTTCLNIAGDRLLPNCSLELTGYLTDWYQDYDEDGDPPAAVPGATLRQLCGGETPPPGFVLLGDLDPLFDPDNSALDDCNDNDPSRDRLDHDGDGQTSCADDPDDHEATVYSGAPELCDALDNDGDGDVDEGFDVDGDTSWVAGQGCEVPYAGDIDCDDGDGSLNQRDDDFDSESTCAGDCDDNDPAVRSIDGDADGFSGCLGASGELPDCNDSDPSQYPADLDGDGYDACPGGADGPADCDDDPSSSTALLKNPGVTTQCDGIDDSNCDGVPEVLEYDGDGDGFTGCGGDCNDLDATLLPVDGDGDGFSSCQGDCDDADAARNPGLAGWCDGIDDTDCNGQDEPGEADVDGDGDTVCDGDCNDFDAVLDLNDDDLDGDSPCDGDCDDTDPSLSTADADGDGWPSCGSVALPDDCDDSDPSLNHVDADGDGASTCAGDCDDTDERLHPNDGDMDLVSPCAGDCDDGDALVLPTGAESRNAVDDDCDGIADDGAFLGGELVLTELMIAANPGDGDGFSEYVEVWNADSLPVDLRGLRFDISPAPANNTSWTAPSGIWELPYLLDPGERAVFARSGNQSTYDFDVADYLWSMPSLPETGGTLEISIGGFLLDTVTWEGSGCIADCAPGSPLPTYSGPGYWRPGHAWSLDESLLGPGAASDNDDPESWCEETTLVGETNWGSPGVPGSLQLCP